MLRNYLKMAVAVLMRRKFLTFVNLFGAALTLTVLVVAFAFLESVVSPAGAEHRHRHFLSIDSVMLTGDFGTLVSGAGWQIYERYAKELETPDMTSFATTPGPTTSYIDGRKITSRLRRTDAAYWRILDFELLEGRDIAADDVDEGRFVAVLSEAAADSWFPGEAAVGRSIVANAESYEVIGVVANEPVTSLLAYADIWVPLSTSRTHERSWIGNGNIILYVDDPSERATVKQELQRALEDFVYEPDPAAFDVVVARAWTRLDMLASAFFRGIVPGVTEVGRDRSTEFVTLAGLVALLFMALPAINMANLNIGRILERAPEVGLRKAAGASRRVLAGQFVFENVVLCALGGLVAFAVAPLILRALTETIFFNFRLGMNGAVFAAGFVFVLVFGLVSGAWPAWKMARLEAAEALRGAHHA